MTVLELAQAIAVVYLYGAAFTLAIIVFLMLSAQAAGHQWSLPKKLLVLGALLAAAGWPYSIKRILSIAFMKGPPRD